MRSPSAGTPSPSALSGGPIEAQAGIGLAGLWGGGHVASVDGMRFVVPVRTLHSAQPSALPARPRVARGDVVEHGQRPNRRARREGRRGTPRDSLHVLDVLYDRDGGVKPQMTVTDTASYSDIVFGLLSLASCWTYRPQLADLPDQKLWRIDPKADYGPFTTAARGRVDLTRAAQHWEDILRIVASIHTGAVRAHDVIRMLSRDGHPTQLGEAIAKAFDQLGSDKAAVRLAGFYALERIGQSMPGQQEASAAATPPRIAWPDTTAASSQARPT
ncbi:Tn3 family transposase [Umezawaea sp. Da 62-37]|uniref:Tn3 family transposase n=1 Tax=Umezawaea sp. Da 62-37 TaxID=3075927 RepID=UPI0037DC8DE9